VRPASHHSTDEMGAFTVDCVLEERTFESSSLVKVPIGQWYPRVAPIVEDGLKHQLVSDVHHRRVLDTRRR
jgi:hypothetical protein